MATNEKSHAMRLPGGGTQSEEIAGPAACRQVDKASNGSTDTFFYLNSVIDWCGAATSSWLEHWRCPACARPLCLSPWPSQVRNGALPDRPGTLLPPATLQQPSPR